MVDDDTPVSSTVSTSPSARPPRAEPSLAPQTEREPLSEALSEGEAGQHLPSDSALPERQSGVSVGLPLARPSSPSAMFVPTSEEEELAVDSGWADESPPTSSVTDATPRSPEVEQIAQSEAARGKPLPRLQLAEPEPPRLLYEKAQDPSEDSPILYCERVFVVDSLLSDEELAEHLLSVLAAIRDGWRQRDSSQFVQLACFDHAFESEPRFPPLATLSWKDWQGRTELWVRGVRRSGAPPTVELGAPESTAPALDQEGGAEDEQPTSEVGELRAHEGDDATPLVAVPERRTPRPGDSGTSWQSPARSGEYPIPNTSAEQEPSEPPPSSQRVPAGEELIGALFERMNELSYLPDLHAGAAYLLETLEEFIPCTGIALHVLDAAAGEFVLVRALAPHAADQLGSRQAETDSALGAAVREQRVLRVDGARNPLWRLLGLEVAHTLCAPVLQRGQVFGAIEIARSASEGDFSDSQLKALEFIGEQFAEFLGERPFDPSELH